MIPARPSAPVARVSRPVILFTTLFFAPVAVTAAPQPIDLATTLRLAGADNLSVKIAREKLAEARADADVARERMFPWVTAGMSFRQHENNSQTVEGRIIDADKRSFSTGIDSPVTSDSSSEERPSTTVPSTGTFSPGRTRSRSPMCTLDRGTSSSEPSALIRRAVFGARP